MWCRRVSGCGGVVARGGGARGGGRAADAGLQPAVPRPTHGARPLPTCRHQESACGMSLV